MNGPQHYAEANAALRRLDDLSADEIQAEMAIAQVHAILALTAAIIDAHDNSADVVDWEGTARPLRQWRDVNDEDAEEGFRVVPASDWARVME